MEGIIKEITKETTINQAIRLYPSIMPVFNRFNIDSCCGGSDTIEEAARKAGIDTGELLAEIDRIIGKK